MRQLFLLIFFLLAGPLSAQGWSEPQRGSNLRAALMDALRPHAEWLLGAPVQFVIHDLRVSGDLAFSSLSPQRPGGGEISLWQTPGSARGDLYPEGMEGGVAMRALYVRSGQTWVAVHWAIGASDVWYAYAPICAIWRPVIPEACQGM
ncbi:hypothetical protein [Antarcticimicrobium sediminis]|uniref:Uncharacterized protein n=1 Tax=Antarcticimicrobium sediminis TaxID=2546227 RepID=A0A4R5EXJ1_9RHOB|nr:hypothetical protein [Antarcticimicrobium sediminis]TDE39683.1 hypothetical protein E1B25_06420 [Antarcticimicrobium sediminis]